MRIRRHPPDDGRIDLFSRLLVAALCRLALNTARRFAYPFAPVLSRGLGVELGAVTGMIAANQLAGLAAFGMGPLGDRFGYRPMMLAGLAMMGSGMLLGAVFPVYGGILLALAMAGLGKSLFDPAIQAYVGEKIPYQRRALVVGLMEISWAGSTLLGIPLIGLLIERAGWKAPFWLLGCVGMACCLTWAWMTRGDTVRPKKAVAALTVLRTWRGLLRNPAARGMVAFAFCISAANDILFVSYGAWFESTFGWQAATLGMGAALIGVAELGGEFLTAAIGDRLGKKRALLTGTVASAIAYAVLPAAGTTLSLALGTLVSIFFFTEFAIVISLSLATEIATDARATMMSGYMAAAGLGRVAGAVTGGFAWTHGGIPAVSVLSTALAVAAAIAFFRGLKGTDLS
jgi:predicted MFS family arabinose efflux permease